MGTVERCEKSDLPIDTCGDTCCRPDLAEQPFVPIQYEGTWSEAQYPGTCGCGCNRRFDEGEDIVLAAVDGTDAWCLLGHTSDPSAVLGGGH